MSLTRASLAIPVRCSTQGLCSGAIEKPSRFSVGAQATTHRLHTPQSPSYKTQPRPGSPGGCSGARFIQIEGRSSHLQSLRIYLLKLVLRPLLHARKVQ